jgi:hypothetical protein
MASFTHERSDHRHKLRAVHADSFYPHVWHYPAARLVQQNRAIRAAFYRTLMRLDLRYTIYEQDVVVIERPQAPDIVVDLSTGRIEDAEN